MSGNVDTMCGKNGDTENPTNGPPEEEWQIGLAKDLNSYVSDYIKFADQKAAFFLALNTAVLALLYKENIHYFWLKSLSLWGFTGWTAFFAYAFHVVGAFWSFRTVMPKLKPTNPEGIIFFNAVAAINTPEEYETLFLAKDKDGMAKELIQHFHSLSNVCSIKYKQLDRAIWYTGLGIALSLFIVIWV